jgi:hypothetical protein
MLSLTQPVQYSHTHTLLLVDNMKPVHIAMIAAAAAYLYYITSQRKNVQVVPGVTFDPTIGTGTYDETGFVAPKFPHTPTPDYAYETGFVAPKFPHTPTPAYAYSTMGRYEGGMNWPARDNIFG